MCANVLFLFLFYSKFMVILNIINKWCICVIIFFLYFCDQIITYIGNSGDYGCK